MALLGKKPCMCIVLWLGIYGTAKYKTMYMYVFMPNG